MLINYLRGTGLCFRPLSKGYGHGSMHKGVIKNILCRSAAAIYNRYKRL